MAILNYDVLRVEAGGPTGIAGILRNRQTGYENTGTYRQAHMRADGNVNYWTPDGYIYATGIAYSNSWYPSAGNVAEMLDALAVAVTGIQGIGVTGLTQYHLPVANAAGNLVDSDLTQGAFDKFKFTNSNNSAVINVNPGAYCTGTYGSVGSIDTGSVPLELNISHQNIRTEGKLTLENSISLNSNSTDAGNPWDGGTSGAPAIINVVGKNVIKLAPSSSSTQYYTLTGAPSSINGQEITVVNENYSTFPIPAIIIQPDGPADMPQHSCNYGKALKLYYDADRGTKPGWISVQDLGCTPYQLYTPTWVGWEGESGPFQPTSYCAFQAIGRKVFVWFYATGPLYAEAPAGVYFTVPSGFTCASAVPHPTPHNLIRVYDGSSWGAGCCNVYGSYITCFPDIAESPWSASGTDRVVSGEIFYEAIP